MIFRFVQYIFSVWGKAPIKMKLYTDHKGLCRGLRECHNTHYVKILCEACATPHPYLVSFSFYTIPLICLLFIYLFHYIRGDECLTHRVCTHPRNLFCLMNMPLAMPFSLQWRKTWHSLMQCGWVTQCHTSLHLLGIISIQPANSVDPCSHCNLQSTTLTSGLHILALTSLNCPLY